MGLVEYSDSESDSETVVAQPPQKPTAAAQASSTTTTATTKKPFQRIVDRSKPGKIVVSLPGAAATRSTHSDAKNDEQPPPPKRARVGGGGGAFSGFNALLPPPKNAGGNKPAASSTSSGKPAPRPGVNLKTGATPGFRRDNDGDFDDDDGGGDRGRAPGPAEPSIPEGQKPADEVKLVGKPMMFKPLSVSRKPAKGKGAALGGVRAAAAAAVAGTTKSTPAAAVVVPPVDGATPPSAAAAVEAGDLGPPKKKKKMSLFSISHEGDADGPTASNAGGVYEPVFASDDNVSTQEAFAQYDAQFASHQHSEVAASADQTSYHQQPLVNTSNDLDSIASDLNLSAAARRELFGRRGVPDPTQSASRVINFNTDREYAANEELRASGEAQPTFNPVRAIAPGKHNLRQLVNQVQNQREALEESFAKGHRNRSEASAKYGWR
ncbi:mitotic checkpoint regulator, MAD2B-interacting-domain-containing protein [Microdochium trichocladiopsis]|uniref:Mitotic checkpoint regulator, MAD2B-interacting-domain-containing protein n=1 Tax=Microdochium trichocladiopsis TaxID=1682393 RepID=A0A9P8YJH6_9PEZI|nr:mitotic checkpoint regulator, MAD2B-interacting-domain-containing protein [Microdochium trichocladiopsis]KAH7041153.1 mitotic checkpoint regulator, MAD2B-interacting-domain-containing protein [Microdochium trichocladiopsis]